MLTKHLVYRCLVMGEMLRFGCALLVYSNYMDAQSGADKPEQTMSKSRNHYRRCSQCFNTYTGRYCPDCYTSTGSPIALPLETIVARAEQRAAEIAANDVYVAEIQAKREERENADRTAFDSAAQWVDENKALVIASGKKEKLGEFYLDASLAKGSLNFAALRFVALVQEMQQAAQ